MRRIDLLNMISKGEKVPLIKYRDKILHWNKEKDRFEDKDGMNTLYEMDFSELNEEIEVIEEGKEIKKLPANPNCIYATDGEMTLVVHKINEIIDKLNEEDKQ